MVSSTGTSASKDSISNDAIDKLPFCFQTILENSKESFKVNSLESRCRNKETKNFTHLEVLTLRAGKIGVNKWFIYFRRPIHYSWL